MVLETMFYAGVPLHLCSENGRRFWSVTIPDPSGWTLAREFCSREEAMAYTDEKLAHNRAYAALPTADRAE